MYTIRNIRCSTRCGYISAIDGDAYHIHTIRKIRCSTRRDYISSFDYQAICINTSRVGSCYTLRGYISAVNVNAACPYTTRQPSRGSTRGYECAAAGDGQRLEVDINSIGATYAVIGRCKFNSHAFTDGDGNFFTVGDTKGYRSRGFPLEAFLEDEGVACLSPGVVVGERRSE